jgi:hypothetical protein
MSAKRCASEDDLLDALGRGFVRAELEAHVVSCSACTELRIVAGALLDDRARAMLEAPVPSAATMWWRMQMRRRHEAEAIARRSLMMGQAATLVIALTLVMSFFGTDVALHVHDLMLTIRLGSPLLIAAATLILVTPLAGWVAVRQK